ncbi:MAG TPA: MarR family transcriptional regulator [Rhodospirillum rubrum]|nr:MarR family transcriptional regulator [Rhodospirillum rubrum]
MAMAMAGASESVCPCASLRQATRHVSRFYDAMLAPSGLGVNQYALLARLARLAPCPQHVLADALVMDRSTLGHLLRPLERRELIGVSISKSDRRSRLLALTPAGAALLAQARPLWQEAQTRIEAVFGAEALATLRALLTGLAQTDLGPCPRPPPAAPSSAAVS